MGQSLAVKYRPKEFNEVCGQEWVVKILEKQIETNNIKNCYLFCGASGSGKTTISRILANKINKGKGYPIEIDAASNSGVDDVRAIIENSNTKSLTSEYKIFILDECHAFSSSAWQALLKTLEEPNSKTIFMLCTTEIQKVPATILNRVQRFDITKISYDQIYNRLKYICEQEKIKYDEPSLSYITKISNGGMRDAIANLEKVISFDSNLSINSVVNILNSVDYKIMFDLTNSIIDRKEDLALSYVNQINNKGMDLKAFINEFTAFILDINKFIILKDFRNIDIPTTYEKELMYVINFEDSSKFFRYMLEQLIKLKENIRYDNDIKTALEVTVLFLCK